MEVVYRNKIYTVFANTDVNEYIILNRGTGIIEDKYSKLPTAIGSAMALEKALIKLIQEQDNA